ncbi:MAG: catalase family peroxidase [Gammaproteobacteria bacterium]|nr:catalase family peroxidase [Gammaproteobacteria bacterium]
MSHESLVDKTVDQFQKNSGVFRGFRRNHAKGVCISGYFASSGKAARYSAAQVFAPGQRTPVVGRLSIPGTNPYSWDDSTPIRGMALKFTQANGEQWRSAMNAVPAFPVATPQANYEFLKAQQPDPATGKPDPKKMARFFASHPRADAFREWVVTTKPSASFATERYNSLDTFMLVDAQGERHAVRWSMLPEATADGEQVPADEPDFLADDLRRRLANGPLRWQLSITLARPGDPINDASRPWPADRPHIDAGTLVLRASQPQKNGSCRDINFDPTVLPAGIELSDDPLLLFRKKVYAVSHRRRTREQAQLHGTTQAPAPQTSS